ncbi:hypothetical protein EIK77_007103 [Talaromyces pinophilus]|nr:hypothetical protein EIK77_007103 [Talaromyces pinophilus]
MKTLNFITGNKNKLSEVRAILGDAVVVDNKSVDVPEIQGTIEEIAKEKCRRAADAVRWDPIFEYEGKTYAEMDKEEKVSETGNSFQSRMTVLTSFFRTKSPTATKPSWN